MQSPVEDWLLKYWQKKDVSQEQIDAIATAVSSGPNAVYAALERIGINVKKGKRPEFEKVRIPALLTMMREGTKQAALRVTDTSTSGVSYPAPLIRNKEGSDEMRLREGVDEAVALGIVREEVFRSDAKHPRDVYILSSAHYGNQDYDPTKTPHHIKKSQVQLFQLLHLLRSKGVQSPIFVEGRTFRMGYNKPMADHWRNQGIDLQDNDVQRGLYQDPEALIRLMDQHQIISARTGASTPIFYEYTNYKHIAGAHTQETADALNAFFADWMPWYEAFEKKYEGLRTMWKGKGERVEFSIGTGWKGNTPLLEIADAWFYAEDVRKDCENFFRYAKALEDIDLARERDVTNLMHDTREGLTPMAFMGLGHTLRVEKMTRPWARTHVLTPSSVTHLDKLRSPKGATDDASPILALDNWKTLYRLASNVPPLKR